MTKAFRILFAEADVALNPIEIRSGMRCVYADGFEKVGFKVFVK